MGKQKKPTAAALREAYVTDLTAVWAYTMRKHGNDQPYLLALYGVEGGVFPELFPQVLTEKALTKVARRYVADGVYKTLDTARDELRPSVSDSPLFDEYAKLKMPAVSKLIKAAVGELGEGEGYGVLGKAAIAAFKQLDKAGVFGEYRSGRKKKLALEVITEGTEDDLWLTVDRKPRPKKKAGNWAKLTAAEPFDETKDIALSPDAGRVYAVTRRDNPNPTSHDDRTVESIVAFAIDGVTLTRVCQHDLPNRPGRSARKLVATPDGRHLIVLIGQHSKVGVAWTSELMRIDAATGTEIEQATVIGSPAAIGISADGRYIAAGTDGGNLVVFDATLKQRHTLSLDLSAQSLVFLRNGHLLIGGDWSIVRVDLANGEVLGTEPFPGHRLSLSSDETLLGASQRYAGGDKNDEPFGAGVLSLPDFQLVQEFDIPGRQLLNAALSPDGRLLAVHARDAQTFDGELRVIDRATGATVLQRQISMVSKGFRFLPDSRRLIAINSECFKGKSLAVWEVFP